MKCMRVPDSRPWQEFWAHRVQGTHRSTLAKAGPASRKGAGDEAPPGDKAREHVIRATTIDAHGLTCKHGGAPVAGGGALLCWGSRMTRKRQACAKEKPTCVIPNVLPEVLIPNITRRFSSPGIVEPCLTCSLRAGTRHARVYRRGR